MTETRKNIGLYNGNEITEPMGRLPFVKGNSREHVGVIVLQVLLAIFLTSTFFMDYGITKAYGHFDHLVHYNGREERVGPYSIFQALDPEYARQKEPVAIEFSVQDREGKDTSDIITMVEIYSAATGERIYATPWTLRDIGDFSIFYTFQERGNYQIVASVAQGDVPINLFDPPRSFLGSTAGCSCLRSVFNVSISEGFGGVWNTAMYIATIAPITVVGGALWFSYRNKKREGYVSKKDLIKYSVVLSALAGGAVHLAVYSDHALHRLEYTIFLLAAAGGQIIYGILYTMSTLTDDANPFPGTASRAQLRAMYKRKFAVNIIGLVGSGVLIGLFVYSVIFPPPLSPTNRPEELEIAGILAKGLEVFLVVGIFLLMRWDKQRAQLMTNTTHSPNK